MQLCKPDRVWRKSKLTRMTRCEAGAGCAFSMRVRRKWDVASQVAEPKPAAGKQPGFTSNPDTHL